MKKLALFISAALVSGGALAATPLKSDNNATVTIEQMSDHNDTFVKQISPGTADFNQVEVSLDDAATHNYSNVYQEGDHNKATVDIVGGDHNDSFIRSVGSGNVSEIDIDGDGADFNYVNINQTSNNSYAEVDIDTSNSYRSHGATASHNDVFVTQTALDSAMVSISSSSHNYVNVYQD